MSLHTEREQTTTERIYRFQCKCGRAGMRRSQTRIVKLTCRDCGNSCEWWKSEPATPFVAPPFPVLTAEQRVELENFDNWRHLSRKSILAELGPDAPHVAEATDSTGAPKSPKCPGCKSDRSRVISQTTGARQCLDCDLITEVGAAAVTSDTDPSDARPQLSLTGLARDPKDKDNLH